MDPSDQFKLGGIPEPQRSTILAALTEVVLSKLALRAYDLLSSQDQAHLEELDESTMTADDTLAFLRSRIPDLDDLIAQIVEEEKAEIAGKTNQLLQVARGQAPITTTDSAHAD